MSNENQETIADIVKEMRDLGRLYEKSTDKIPRSLQALELRTYADRIENEAQHIREYCYEITTAIKKCFAALSSPQRNCDRPECATTKAAQDVWSKEDGGKTAYYEWLLATYTEGGTTDGKKH